MKNKLIYLFFAVIAFQIGLAVFQYTSFTIDDAAIHAQIVNPVLRNHIYPRTYEPVASVGLTYPLLFHYIALIFNIFGFSALSSVRIVGGIAFALFPLCVFLVGSLFNRKTAYFALFASLVVANFTMLIIVDAFPQILAFDLFCLFLYFIIKKQHVVAGIFLGLIFLAHPFMAVFSLICFLFLVIQNKEKGYIKTFLIAAIISLFWIRQYLALAINIFTGTWNNVRWYDMNPGLIHFETATEYLYRLNPFLLAVAFLALSCKDRKKTFFSFIFIFSLFFTFYHYPPAQLKFLDVATIPLIIMAAIGLDHLSKLFKPRKFYAVLLIFFIISITVPITFISDYHRRFSPINSVEEDAALFLQVYDGKQERIVANITSEVLFAQLSNKLPMDGKISDLEAYNAEYRQQLLDREEIINGDYELAKKYNVRYLVTQDCKFNVIYRKNITICEFAG